MQGPDVTVATFFNTLLVNSIIKMREFSNRAGIELLEHFMCGCDGYFSGQRGTRTDGQVNVSETLAFSGSLHKIASVSGEGQN